jgi:3-hydroxyisobutyrate dehydrogenase-like beta-hydroxyacid dehydrogenase
VKDTETALAKWADVVLSILPPGDALALAKRLAPIMAGKIYADCNAISPTTMQAVAAALPGVRVVDGGIIGGPGESGPGPRLYVSGDAAEALLPLKGWGIDLRPIPGGIGAASALKMSYSGITKGLIALGSAMALGATQSGAAAALRAELASSQPDILRLLDRGVPSMFDKAYRWVAEMEEISAFLGDLPAAPIYQGAARLYEAIAADRASAKPDGMVARLATFYSGAKK